MFKLNLKTVSQILTEKELKNVLGGSGGSTCTNTCNPGGCSKNEKCVREHLTDKTCICKQIA